MCSDADSDSVMCGGWNMAVADWSGDTKGIYYCFTIIVALNVQMYVFCKYVADDRKTIKWKLASFIGR